MDIIDIIKESFIFPSKNLKELIIYIVLTFLIGFFTVGTFVSVYIALPQNHFPLLGTIFTIISLIIGLIVTGYQISILKSGINNDENTPSFDLKNNLITGIKMLFVGIIYMIIPTIIMFIVGFATNIPGQITNIYQNILLNSVNATSIANSASPVLSTIPDSTMIALNSSITITLIVSLVLFIIFSFLETMGESRLAKTGSLSEALNIIESFKDITRIGAVKVIVVIFVVILIVFIINSILGYVSQFIPQLTILSIIMSPYLVFFTQRAKGLLYSDIG